VSARAYMLEGLEPCGDNWQQLHPPEWWNDESGDHDGMWRAASPSAVIKAFLIAYPGYPMPSPAKSYRSFRVTPASAQRRFRIVDENNGCSEVFGGMASRIGGESE
jgi:hypothetical protein